MELKPNVGSDRSWVYTAHDYSESEPTTELLAVRFANKENAEIFKERFTEAQQINEEKKKSEGTDETDETEETKETAGEKEVSDEKEERETKANAQEPEKRDA